MNKIINSEDSTYESIKALADSMKKYGDAAIKYFNKKADDNLYESFENINLQKYKPEVTGSVDGINYIGSSLILNSRTSIRHYFSIKSGIEVSDYNFTVNGKDVIPSYNGVYYYIEVSNICAQDIGKTYTIHVQGADGDMSIRYSGLSYAYMVLTGSSDTNLKELMETLYYYNKEAVEYSKAV